VTVAATLGMSVSYIDRQTLAAIAPAVRAGLAIDHAQFGWLVSGFSMAYLVGTPIAGALLDRVGARRGFAAAVLVWSAVAGAHALAVSFTTLFALRVLLGAAESPSFPAAAQAIRRALPSGRRPAAYGLLFTGSSIGAMVAPPLAIALEAAFGFRFAFLLTALVGLLWVPLWLGATRGDFGAGVTAEPSSVAASAGERTSWIVMARSAAVLRALVAIFGCAPALMLVSNFSSQYLVETWHLKRDAIGGLLVLPPLVFDIGAVGFGWLASRRPARTHHGLLALAALLVATLALAPFATSAAVAMALFAACECGGAGIYVLVTADMLARVPVDRASSAGGMTAAAQSLALIIAAPLVGFLIDKTGGYGAALVALGIMAVPTTAIFAAWPVSATSSVGADRKAPVSRPSSAT
jgi:ACS family hexuronate transporter-like MFS transporter